MKITILFSLCALVVFFSACVKKQPEAPSNAAIEAPGMTSKSPEEVVKYFIELSAAAKEDDVRNKLQGLCQGEMRQAFERMTPEAFKISYLDSNLKLKDVKILEKSTENTKAKVVYEVLLDNPTGTDATTETNQREVELVQQQGAWYIETIRPKGSDKIAFTRGMIF